MSSHPRSFICPAVCTCAVSISSRILSTPSLYQNNLIVVQIHQRQARFDLAAKLTDLRRAVAAHLGQALAGHQLTRRKRELTRVMHALTLY